MGVSPIEEGRARDEKGSAMSMYWAMGQKWVIYRRDTFLPQG